MVIKENAMSDTRTSVNRSKGLIRNLSLVPASLWYKMIIVFCLMSVIPLMICVYIATNFVFPYMGMTGLLSVVIAIAILIALLGLILARKMIEPIIDIAIEARLIAGGDFERSIKISEEGEIGDLASSLNAMTDKIRTNLTELKIYGDKTREINSEIHRKVMALSGLLQVGNLISAGTGLKTILDILAEKISLLDDSCPVMVMFLDKERDYLMPCSVMNIEDPEAARMPLSLKQGFFARLRTDIHLRDIIIDSDNRQEDEHVNSIRQAFGIRNIAIVPVIVRGSLEGAIFMGNSNDNFVYKKDDLELLHVFSKQVAIAFENDKLLKKTEELEIKDGLTQLYNAKFIKERLDEEIKRGMIYQRPCSFILFNVDGFKPFCDKYGRMTGESVLKKIARLIMDEITPVDRAGRFGDDEFALILPERYKKESKKIAEELKNKISELCIMRSKEEDRVSITVSASLSENPIDGISAKELIDKAKDLMGQAKKEGSNTVKA
jgi:diguanylate cyclase (GGDEF)-like protein